MEAAGKNYLTCLWPGLPELWYRGQLSALPAAVTFACVLNFLLVARFLYPEWLTPLLVKLACWVALAVWIFSVAKAVRRLPQVISPRAVSDRPDRFAEAHIQYLRGHWVAAEALLIDCLEIEARDPPALLLLAGVYRHTDRLAAAANILEQLQRLERGDYWWLELQDERKRLKRFEQAQESEPSDAASEDSEDDPQPQAVEAQAGAGKGAEQDVMEPQSSVEAADEAASRALLASAADRAFAADMADPLS